MPVRLPTLFTAFYLFITSPHSFLNSFGEKALQPGNFSSHHASQDALVRNRSRSNIETKAQRCLQSRGVSDRKWWCEEEEHKCRPRKELTKRRAAAQKAAMTRKECPDPVKRRQVRVYMRFDSTLIPKGQAKTKMMAPSSGCLVDVGSAAHIAPQSRSSLGCHWYRM